jgi:hypothetical protein
LSRWANLVELLLIGDVMDLLGWGLNVHHHRLLLGLGKLSVLLVVDRHWLGARHGMSKTKVLILVSRCWHGDLIMTFGVILNERRSIWVRNYSLVMILNKDNKKIWERFTFSAIFYFDSLVGIPVELR